jgi:hypothetical protein
VKEETYADGTYASDVMGADPVLIAHAAGEMLTVAQHLAEDARPLLLALDVPERAYGSTDAGPGLAIAHQLSLADVEGVLDRLGGVLEGDVDRLCRIAFAVDDADRSATGRMSHAGRRAPAVAADVRRQPVR